jgi:hypothetical protein
MKPTDTYDVKRAHPELYAPRPGVIALVDVPELAFLMVDGHGDPNTAPAYREAVEALYAVSYAVRFAAKKQLGRVHVVGPLEGLWWADDLEAFLTRAKSEWSWTVMIHQPEWITAELVATARETAAAKRDLPALERMRYERLNEGPSVQTLHVGPYDNEAPVIATMHEHAAAQGFALHGKHHEIYLSDPRKVEAAKLRTVLRQPVMTRP